jgi:sugar lactone lactonase YvrE
VSPTASADRPPAALPVPAAPPAPRSVPYAALAQLLMLLATAGCGAASTASDAGSDAGHDAGFVANIDFIGFDAGAPETVLWDDAHSRLFVVDNTGNRVWTWTDLGGLSATPYAALPLPADAGTLAPNVTLGQAALLADGTLVVNRFGQPGGGAGDISYVGPGGTSATLVPNLDPTRRRLGLAVAPDGTLYGSYFAGGADGGIVGFVTTVDLHAGETVVADGFGKIVGLAITRGRLYVSDQSNAKVVDAPLSALPAHAAAWDTLATFVKPDQICVGPDNSLFSGQFQGAAGSSDPISVRQVSSTGVVTLFKSDPDVSKPSGVWYDATHHRLFVADSGNSAHIGIHVFAVP